MHSVLGALLAVVVAAVPFTPSLPGPEPEAARGHHIPVRGELVIGPQGEVQQVEVAAGPPSAVRHFVRGAVGGWRFEPVLEAGQAATVRTGFALSVLARPEGDGFELTIEGAWFGSEHPLAAGQATPRMPARATRTGIGGLVVVAARLAADGRVEAVHAYHSGLEAAPISTMAAQGLRQAYEHSALAAAARWRLDTAQLPADLPGRTVLIPVHFSHGPKDARRLVRFDMGEPRPAPWLDADPFAGAASPGLAEGGAYLADSRIRLQNGPQSGP